VNGPTVSEYYGLIRLPDNHRRPYLAFRFGPPGFSTQELSGSPKSLVLLSTHTALFVNPGRPSEHSPLLALCMGFPSVNPVLSKAKERSPSALCSANGAVSSLVLSLAKDQGVQSPRSLP